MARPISWLPRVHDIRRSISNSSLSHFDRKDIERAFGLQPRAAQKLLEIFPATRVGSSRLVERESVNAFLDKVQQSGDVARLINQERRSAAAPSSKKPRHIVRTDLPAVRLDALPDKLTLETGRLEIRFSNLEEMAQTLFGIAQLLEFEGDEFARLYEPALAKTPIPTSRRSGACSRNWKKWKLRKTGPLKILKRFLLLPLSCHTRQDNLTVGHLEWQGLPI